MNKLIFSALTLTFLLGHQVNAFEINKFLKTQNISKTVNQITDTISHDSWDLFLKKYVDNKGLVDYKSIKSEVTVLNLYLTKLSKNTPNDSWSKDEKMAYWINAYNAFTIKLIIDYYPINSINDIKKPWDIKFIELGPNTYSLNDLEHNILRKMGDPRIHFGIVCASFSCPKLQNEAFVASKLNNQLNSATKEFLADSDRNNLSEKTIEISKIFKWFSKDFKNDGTLIDFLNNYSDVIILPNAKKTFKEYNWSLNE